MYQQRIVIDGLQYCNWNREYFQTLKASGITAVHATVVYHENTRETLTRFAEWNLRFEQNADLIMPIHTMADVEEAKATGRVRFRRAIESSLLCPYLSFGCASLIVIDVLQRVRIYVVFIEAYVNGCCLKQATEPASQKRIQRTPLTFLL